MHQALLPVTAAVTSAQPPFLDHLFIVMKFEKEREQRKGKGRGKVRVTGLVGLVGLAGLAGSKEDEKMSHFYPFTHLLLKKGK